MNVPNEDAIPLGNDQSVRVNVAAKGPRIKGHVAGFLKVKNSTVTIARGMACTLDPNVQKRNLFTNHLDGSIDTDLQRDVANAFGTKVTVELSEKFNTGSGDDVLEFFMKGGREDELDDGFFSQGRSDRMGMNHQLGSTYDGVYDE